MPFKLLPDNGVVTVAGEVARPAPTMPLRANPPLTLREAINLAGGLTPTANRKAITVRRSNGTALVLDLDKAEENDPSNNIELKADDAIYVERVTPSEFVNVAGGVPKAGKLVYEKPMTVTKAIFEAGGPLPLVKEKER